MTTLFRGGEDIDFSVIGGSYGLTNAANIWVNSTAGGAAFREGYARCALSPGGGVTGLHANNSIWIRTRAFSASDFWLSARLSYQQGDPAITWSGVGQDGLLRIRDAGLVTRLRLYPSPGLPRMAAPFLLQKVTAAGVATTLATTTSGFSLLPSSPDKLDIALNYGVAGSARIYINGTLVLTYDGDLTTDGATALAFVELGSISLQANSDGTNNWSEVIVSTQDTRNQSLVTRAPVAAGETDDWTGTAGDMNDLRANDANPNLSVTADQVQEYTLTALPAGSFAILDVTQVVRATAGATGPQHVQLGNRIAGTEYFSSDLAPTVAWDTYSYTTTLNPATGLAYTQDALDAVDYNFAMKSTT